MPGIVPIEAYMAVVPAGKDIARIAGAAKKALEKVKEESAGYGAILRVVFGGSYIKDTWIRDGADIDILVIFKKDTPGKIFEEAALKVGRAALKGCSPRTRYAEHPFVEGTADGIKINVVPCFNVRRGDWKSAADRTPHHAKFMKKELAVAGKRTQVRLLKTFLKSNGLYGAEIAKRGFSGYLTESLIYYLNTFEGVARAFADIECGQVIGRPEKAFDTHIAIADPIDPKRNLAAAVSIENLGRFVLLCRAFLAKPSASFFEPAAMKFDSEIMRECVTIRFKYRPRSPEIIWGQLHKAAGALARQLKCAGFGVVKGGAATDEKGFAVLFFLLSGVQIPEYGVRRGPEFYRGAEDTAEFIRKNWDKSKLVWLEDGRICSLERRKGDAVSLLAELLEGGAEDAGMPGGLNGDMAKFKIVLGDGGLPKAIKAQLRQELSTNAALLYSNS